MDSYDYGYDALVFPAAFGFDFNKDDMDDYINGLEDDVKKEVLIRREEFQSKAEIESFVDDFYM